MNYQCCICKQAITLEDKTANRNNPCALTITTNYNDSIWSKRNKLFSAILSVSKNFIVMTQLFIWRDSKQL